MFTHQAYGDILFVILLLVFVPVEIIYGENFILLFSLIGLKEKKRQTEAPATAASHLGTFGETQTFYILA